jgi:hypothetical protein
MVESHSSSEKPKTAGWSFWLTVSLILLIVLSRSYSRQDTPIVVTDRAKTNPLPWVAFARSIHLKVSTGQRI